MLRRIVAAALVVVPLPAAAGETLSVVSYNVHGLPAWIAGDDPAARMPAIGPRLARYDVALVQEDWSYGERLAESTGLALRVAGNAARSAWLRSLSFFCGACGSGLALFSKLGRERLLSAEALPYDLCADWITSANDCWATKGFVFARLRLHSGAELDVVNTHLEAGDGEADLAVREQQLEILGRFLAARSAGRALVLGGDLNLPFDDARQRAAVERFAAALGLSDAGARPAEPGRWEKRLDYILWRSGEGTGLSLLEAGEDGGFSRGGAPLSDHPAVFARFRVTP